jgi:hypothetical protein
MSFAYSPRRISLSEKKSSGAILIGFLFSFSAFMPAFSARFNIGETYEQLRYVMRGGSVNFECLQVSMHKYTDEMRHLLQGK